MKLFKKPLTTRIMNNMKSKSLPYLILLIVPLFFVSIGFAVKNASTGSASINVSDQKKCVVDSVALHPWSPPTTLSSATVEAVASNILLQSTDGGKTWQDISESLPIIHQPENFFAGESGLYVHIKNAIYHSESNMTTPVWKRESIPGMRSPAIAFNPSGIIVFNYEGKIYQRKAAGTWAPVYPGIKNQLHMIFETTDGTLLVGSQGSLFKSSDKGQTWKQVQQQGGVMEIVESNGVFMATGQKGIMRSTDKGEHWEWVISEGGVGIDVEVIEGGFAAIAYNTTTETRRVHISTDGGKTWDAVHDGLPNSLSISSIKQMGEYLICGHPDGIFRSSDMGETWELVHPDVEEFNSVTASSKPFENSRINDVKKKVFKIYASGNTLYAVARNMGC